MDTEILNLIFWEKYGSKKTYLSEKNSKTTPNFSRFFLVTTEEFVRKTRYCSGFVKSKIFPITKLAFLWEKTLLWKMQISCFCSLLDMFSIFFLRVPSSLPLLKIMFFILRPSGLARTVLRPSLIWKYSFKTFGNNYYFALIII